MRRLADLFLGTLAVGAAVAMLLKSRPRPSGAGPVRPASSVAAPQRSVVDETPDEVPHGMGQVSADEETSEQDSSDDAGPGGDSPEWPASVPPQGRRILGFLKTIAARVKDHNTVIIAAALAYYAFLAVFPASIAALSIYGLVADTDELEQQLTDLTEALPAETAEFIQNQLLGVTQLSGLGVATIVGIALALWSASAGTKALISGINIAYDEEETRNFIHLRGLAFGLTLGIILFVIAMVASTAILPPLLDDFGLRSETITLINVFRWPVVFLVVLIGLGGLYKIAPNRPMSRSPWLNWGAVFAAVGWVLATLGLTLYSLVGEAGAAYGTLAGLALLMLWFFVSGLVVLMGAEINDELEERRAYA